MQKKYQIFVSSTFKDLADERQDAIRNILDLGHIPAGMELFPASDNEQLDYIKKIIDECDYYLLIIGGRYGSMDNEGISFTDREYEYAVEKRKPVLAFIHGSPEKLSIENSDIDPRIAARLSEFKERVSKGRLVKFWTTKESLALAILKTLPKEFQGNPQIGWIRGDAAASEDIIQQILTLRDENEVLKLEIEKIGSKDKPIIANLANIEEKYKLLYNVETYYNGDYRNSRTFISIRWIDLFFAVGPKLFGPQPPSIIPSSISTYLQNRNQGIDSTISVTDEIGDQIKIQFMALNLIKSCTLDTPKGNTSEFIEITDLGRSKLLDSMSVKSEI